MYFTCAEEHQLPELISNKGSLVLIVDKSCNWSILIHGKYYYNVLYNYNDESLKNFFLNW
jgi:hypothetical protein